MAPTGSEIIAGFVPTSPFCIHLGITIDELGDGEATLRMPFREELVTVGHVVHGGAVGSLIDTTGMAAAWAGAEPPENLRGTTVGLTITYLSAAGGTDLTARGRVLKRGRSLVYVEVDVEDEQGEAIAKGLVTYKLG